MGPREDHPEVSTFGWRRREPSCTRRYTRDCYKVMKRSKKTMGAGRVGFKKVEFESAILCSMVENITQKRYSICRVISGSEKGEMLAFKLTD